MSLMVPLQELSPARPRGSPGRARVVDVDDGDIEPTMASSAPVYNTMDSQSVSPRYIALCLAVIVFVVQFGASLADVPSVHLLEDLICHQFYDLPANAMIVGEQCLVSEVQRELNIISTGSLIFGYLPGILVAIPFGALADRIGRKPILVVCISGMAISQTLWILAAWRWQLNGDLRHVWGSSIALLIGGGESVAEAIVFAIIADVAPEGKRAVYFQIEICSVLLAEAFAPFAATTMMKTWAWLPIIWSPAIMVAGCILIFLIPETLDTNQEGASRIRRVARTRTTFSARVRRYATQTLEPSSRWSRARSAGVSVLRLFNTRNIVLLLPGASLTIPIATVTLGIMLRYLPIRFGWTLEQAGMILGTRTAFNIVALLVLLPVISSVMLSNRTNNDRDLILARICAVFLVAGQTLFAFAPDPRAALLGLFVLTFGTGVPCLCRAVLSRTLGPQSAGRVFSLLAVCEMLGFLSSGVGFSAMFQYGLGHGLGSDGTLNQHGRLLMGLMFSVAALVYLCAGGFLSFVKLRGQDADVESLHSDASDSHLLHEARVLADGRVTRKHPSLENASVVI